MKRFTGIVIVLASAAASGACYRRPPVLVMPPGFKVDSALIGTKRSKDTVSAIAAPAGAARTYRPSPMVIQ
jgi:hypothetical protein